LLLTHTHAGRHFPLTPTAGATRNVMGRDESVFEGKTLDDAVRKGLSDLG